MAKKKSKKTSKKTVNLIKKGIAAFASLLTFIFMFLEVVVKENVYKSFLNGEKTIERTGFNFFEYLVSSDSVVEAWREQFTTATAFMWIVLVLVVAALALTVVGLVLKKGSLFSKIGSVVLVFGLLLLNLVHVDVVEIANYSTYLTNITVLYFVALVISIGGAVSAFIVKE